MNSPIDAPRQGLGIFFQMLLEYLDDAKLRAQVYEKVSPATRKLMEVPPRALAFMASTAIDEVETVLGEIGGTDALLAAGRHAARSLGGSIVQPVMRTAFFFLGQTPAAVFGNLDRFYSLVTRGIHFRWLPDGDEHGGHIEVRFDGPGTPRAAFEVLRGTLLFVYEASVHPRGTIDPPEIVTESTDGSTIRLRAHW